MNADRPARFDEGPGQVPGTYWTQMPGTSVQKGM